MGLVGPTMVWKWLSSEALIQQYGTKVWSLVPTMRRPWWIEEVLVYGSVTLDIPPAAFADVILTKHELESAIELKKAAQLKQAVNEHLHMVVKCHWGCEEFYHRCGEEVGCSCSSSAWQ